MGSIPVAGAKREPAFVAGSLLASAQRTHSEAEPRNGVRIPRPKIDKLACQAKDEGIFAAGEIPEKETVLTIFRKGVIIKPINKRKGDRYGY